MECCWFRAPGMRLIVKACLDWQRAVLDWTIQRLNPFNSNLFSTSSCTPHRFNHWPSPLLNPHDQAFCFHTHTLAAFKFIVLSRTFQLIQSWTYFHHDIQTILCWQFQLYCQIKDPCELSCLYCVTLPFSW